MNDDAIQELWNRTNAAIEAGAFNREAYFDHVREEYALLGDDLRAGLGLEAAVQLGMRLGFIDEPEDLDEILGPDPAVDPEPDEPILVVGDGTP